MGFVAAGPPGGSNGFSTVQNLIKPFIGVGILALPKVWGAGGVALSSGFLSALAYVAFWAIMRLVECADLIILAESRRNARQRIAAAAAVSAGRSHSGALPAPSPTNSSPSSLSASGNHASYSSSDDPAANVPEVAPFSRDYFDDSMITAEDRESVTLPTFTEVGKAAYGYWGGLAVDISILITQVGACLAYIVFMSQNLHDVMGLPAPVWVGILFVPLALLSTIRRMDHLAPTSAMGNVVYVFTIIVIMVQGYRTSCCVKKDDIHWANFTAMPLIFGTSSFALEGIALVLPVKNRMRTPSDFPHLMVVSMGIVTSLYLFFSIFGYLFFGENVGSPIIVSLPDDALTATVKISLSVAIFFTFVLQTFPASTFFDEVIDGRLGVNMAELKAAKLQERSIAAANGDRSVLNASGEIEKSDLDDPEVLIPHIAGRRFALQNLARFLFVAFVCVVGIIFPDFKLIVSLFGSLSNAMLAYVFPAMFWLRICSHSPLYGYDYIPFSRHGTPQADPFAEDIAAQAGADASILSGAGGAAAASDSDYHHQGSTKVRVVAGGKRVNGEDDDATLAGLGASDEVVINHPSTGSKIWWMWFPITVSVMGILAYIVGVSDALKDIVHEFS